jgi:hypothetical protein
MSDSKAQALAIRQSVGIERLGEIMWKSGFFADTRSQAQAIVKILAGAELDFGPVASMNGISIISGRTTLGANLVGAAIQRSGRYRYRVVEQTNERCTIDFFEMASGGKEREKIGSSTFSMEDARAAQLAETANWKKFPRNMLWSRAMTNGARWFCPDVFNGPVYTPDELGVEVDDAGNPIEVSERPEAPADKFVPLPAREVEDRPRPSAEMVTSADAPVWVRWCDVRSRALEMGVRDVPKLVLPLAKSQLVSAGLKLAQDIEARQAQLDQEEAERRAGASKNTAWERNRALMAETYAAGWRLRELPVTASQAEVSQRNAEIEEMLDKSRRAAARQDL